MIITVASVVIIAVLAIWASQSGEIKFNEVAIDDYDDELQSGNFKDVPTLVLLGQNGYLCITDESGDIIYDSSDETHSFTPTEIACIQNYGSKYVISSDKYEVEGGTNYLVTRSYEENGETVKQYILLNDRYEVISSSISLNVTGFTETEFKYFTYNQSKNGNVLEKYPFERNGNTYYAIYLDTNNDEGISTYIFTIIAVLIIIGVMVASLVLYIRYINKHVQRPLKALGVAMTDFAKSEYRQKLNYRGSKEFEQLVDSFNEMVTLLNDSEKSRTLLEQDKQRMLTGLSHDIKTPITIIQGYAKAMRDGMISEEDKQKYLSLIAAKAENLSVLVDSFFEYTKLDHPDFKLHSEPIDVNELLRTYLAAKYTEFEINGYFLEVDIGDDPLICNADKNQLQRVFENLSNNFFKYTSQGSTLLVRTISKNDNIVIYFADNGTGIPYDAHNDIFSPFVVGEESRNKQGSGLGLAVCKKIAEAHGGTILLSPVPIEGYNTQFEITLPIYKS